ncbi:MAG: hypothetical protein Q8R24_07305 [Legionellaceae bacterium]|nr:hypothetical protein [Legionellaceae bacterium]
MMQKIDPGYNSTSMCSEGFEGLLPISTDAILSYLRPFGSNRKTTLRTLHLKMGDIGWDMGLHLKMMAMSSFSTFVGAAGGLISGVTEIFQKTAKELSGFSVGILVLGLVVYIAAVAIAIALTLVMAAVRLSLMTIAFATRSVATVLSPIVTAPKPYDSQRKWSLFCLEMPRPANNDTMTEGLRIEGTL